MTRSVRTVALALLAALLAGSEASAQPTALTWPAPERLKYERGFEWAGEPYTRLALERQSDGSYLAEIGGQDHVARTGIRVEPLQLMRLRERLADMDAFPAASFAGDGNHDTTSLEVEGTDAAGQPWSLRRSFFHPSDADLYRRVRALDEAVLALIEEVTRPRLDRFVYERGIEWGGHHAKTRLRLTRQQDGSYLADVGGEDHADRGGVPVKEAQLTELRRTLHALRDFPDDSFAGDGNHWYTRLRADGEDPAGTPWRFARSCYDPNHPKGQRAIDELEEAVTRLIASLPPAQPTSGAGSAPATSAGLIGGLPQ